MGLLQEMMGEGRIDSGSNIESAAAIMMYIMLHVEAEGQERGKY